MSKASRPLTRSYAVADLNNVGKVIEALDKFRKWKATDESVEAILSSGSEPSSPPKRKHGRPKGSKNKPKSNQPAESNKELDETDIEMSPPIPPKAKRPSIAPHSPLPNHTNCVVNPGKPDAKRTKWTSAEVAVAAKQKEDLKKKVEELEKQQIQTLAEIELQEEMEAAEEESNAVYAQDDLMDDEEVVPAQSENVFSTDKVPEALEPELVEINSNYGSDGKETVVKKAPAKKAVCQLCDDWFSGLLTYGLEQKETCKGENTSSRGHCKGSNEG